MQSLGKFNGYRRLPLTIDEHLLEQEVILWNLFSILAIVNFFQLTRTDRQHSYSACLFEEFKSFRERYPLSYGVWRTRVSVQL